MTEVDYSPEAYQRYMATKNRVTNWAADTSRHASQYTHPFDSHQPRQPTASYGPVPEVRPDDSISLYDGGAAKRARSMDRHHQRSRSIPAPPPPLPRARSHPAAQPRPVAAPPPAQVYYPAPQYNAPVRAAPAPPPPPPPPPPPAQPTYRTIDLSKYTKRGEFILPPPPPGETYMIIPPKGKRIEVVSPPGTKAHGNVTMSYSTPASPTKRNSRSHSSSTQSSNRSRSPTGPGVPTHHQLPALPAPGYSYGQATLYAPVTASRDAGARSSKKPQQPLLKRLFTVRD